MKEGRVFTILSNVILSLSTLLKADLSKCEGIRSRLRQAQPDSKELKLTAEDKIEATLQNQLSNVTLSLSKWGLASPEFFIEKSNFVTLSLSTLLKADLSKCEGIRSRLRQAQPDSKELKLTAEDKIEATLQNQLSNVTLSLSKWGLASPEFFIEKSNFVTLSLSTPLKAGLSKGVILSLSKGVILISKPLYS